MKNRNKITALKKELMKLRKQVQISCTASKLSPFPYEYRGLEGSGFADGLSPIF